MHRIYEGFVNVLGIEHFEAKGKDLLIFPNPSTNKITIQSEYATFEKFRIYDQTGRPVHYGQLSGVLTEINLSHLSNGSYIFVVEGSYNPSFFVKN
jgi:hypothetical protein